MAHTWHVSDAAWSEAIPDVTSMAEAVEAAREIIRDGVWPEGEGRHYHDTRICERDESGRIVASETIEVLVGSDPEEPECTHADGHAWGESESWGIVGTQISIRDRCAHCGCRRTTITESTPGQLPHEPERVTYREDGEDYE